MFCYQRRHLIVTSLPWALHSQLLPLSDGAVRDRTTKARPRHFMLFFLPPFFFLTLLEPLIEEAQPTFYSWFVEFLHLPSREVRQEMDGAVFPFLRKDHTGSPGRATSEMEMQETALSVFGVGNLSGRKKQKKIIH